MTELAASEASEAPVPAPRRGGRPKGSLNLATRDLRAAASKYTARSLRVLWKLASESADEMVQLKAAVEILDRGHGRPSQTTLVGGDGGDPIKAQRVADLMADPQETARRVALLLYAGDPNYRAAADAEREARNRGGRQGCWR